MSRLRRSKGIKPLSLERICLKLSCTVLSMRIKSPYGPYMLFSALLPKTENLSPSPEASHPIPKVKYFIAGIIP